MSYRKLGISVAHILTIISVIAFFAGCIITKNAAARTDFPEPPDKPIMVSVNDVSDDSDLRKFLAESGSFQLLRSPDVKNALHIDSEGFKRQSSLSAGLALYNLIAILNLWTVLPGVEPKALVLKARIKDNRDNSSEEFIERVEMTEMTWLLGSVLGLSKRFNLSENMEIAQKQLVVQLIQRLRKKAENKR